MAKVSIIVPVYNVEEYLEKCLDSLVNQTLQDIEIIVVNDGSPDNSQQIIDAYIEKYPDKIKGFIKENGGLSDARNYGITKASADYIGFVDSDDYIELDMYEKLYEKAIQGRYDMVDSSYFIESNTMSKITGILPESFTKSQYIERFIVCFCTKLIHKKLLENVGKIPIMWHEDVAYIPCIASYAKNIGYVNKPLYHYYTRENSISNSVFNSRVLDLIKAVDFAQQHCNQEFKEEVTVQLLKILDRSVLVRWYYSDAFVSKIRDIKEFVFSSTMPERYPTLINNLQKYWTLSDDIITKRFYINGFNKNQEKKNLDRLKNLGFYDVEAEIVILDEESCNMQDPIISPEYEKQNYKLVGIYFAIQKIIEEGGIYISNLFDIDNPFNAMLPFDAFFAYSGKEVFSEDIFGGKKQSTIFKKILEKVSTTLQENEIPEIPLLLADCIKQEFSGHLDCCTKLYENNIALLRPEAVYYYLDELNNKGKNALHFCHSKINNDGMIAVPCSLLEHYCKSNNTILVNKNEKEKLFKQSQFLKRRISEYENSTIWKATKPLRKIINKQRQIKRKVFPELKVEYKNLIQTRKRLEKEYAIPKLILEKYSAMDCLENYRVLLEFNEELKKEKYATNCAYYTKDPGAYYGIQRDMLNYAEIKEENEINDYALIEHGAHFQNIAPFGGGGKQRYTGYITLGEYRKEFLLKQYRLPVYTVGPFIAYSEQYYNSKKLKDLKEKWGKTLLIFYAHNHEWLEKSYSNEEFIQLVKKQQKNFKTVVLCCYWADVDKDYVKIFEEMGVKIVSCGFRSDNNFMQRQKTLITLSDYILTNDIGSHFGYSIYLDKPVTFLETAVITTKSKEHLSDKAAWIIENNKKKISEYFTAENGTLNTKITQIQRDICEPYFGFQHVKTKEEIEAIFWLSQKIYQKSNKRIGGYKESIEKIYRNLEKSRNQEDIIRFETLKDALNRK